MGFVQLIVAILALNLFLLFLAQPFLVVWRVFFSGRSDDAVEEEVLEDPNSVDPVPVEDLDEIQSAWLRGRKVKRLGRNRFNRLVYRITDPDGRVGYYYWDMEAHERRRTGTARPREATSPKVDDSRLTLGWKGFTADSSPWEVLGVARDASINQIKAAYRKLITKYHPDRFSNLTDAEIEQLEQDSKLINAAYSKLVKP
jgi:hypothetical protein